MVKISVIIPSYNQEDYLPQAIISAANQLDPHDEIIVVDDYSTDYSVEVIRMMQRADKRIQLVQHEVNKGIADARNTGVQYAQGDWIAFLSADDCWEPTFLKETLEEAEKTGGKLIYTNYWRIDEWNERTGFIDEITFTRHADFVMHAFQRCNVNFSALLIHKSVFKEVGLFEPSLRYGEDYLWLLKSLKHFQYFHLPKRLCNYRIHAKQTTNQYLDKIKENDNKIREMARRYWQEETAGILQSPLSAM